jgi:hypothetical protein
MSRRPEHTAAKGGADAATRIVNRAFASIVREPELCWKPTIGAALS